MMISFIPCMFICAICGCMTVVFSDFTPADENADRTSSLKDKQTAIKKILQLENRLEADHGTEKVLKALLEIYRNKIKPLEDAYHFADLNRDAISEGEIFAKPTILFLGPWSTGKSTIINYLLGIEDGNWKLHTSAEPTTSEFIVLNHGPGLRIVKGMQLVADQTKQYTILHKFGLSFLERFEGVELPSPLLEKVTLVDTPGIIENKKQQERGYPFNEVCQWFIDRAQMIFLIFDPTKLDFGSELEILFKLLKGHEAKLRIILNKADTVSTQELMRVYGALFWSLAPLVSEVEPPRVYVGSLWSRPFQPGTMHSLFEREEVSLLNDIALVIRSQLEHKIASARRHAFLVRLHALTVECYCNAFEANKYIFFFDSAPVWQQILNAPDKYSVFSQLTNNLDISTHDLPSPERYRTFFATNEKSSFPKLSDLCPFFTFWKCPMEELQLAINVDLPNLLNELVTSGQTCDSQSCGQT